MIKVEWLILIIYLFNYRTKTLTGHTPLFELVANTLKIDLPSDIVETSFSKANQFPFETKTSLQRDVETKGRQSEWDLFGGTVVRYAERLNIPANNTKKTLDKLLQNL